jgi:type IV secretion system protein VirB3
VTAQRETLFVACTRPAMKGGVPFEGWLLNIAGTTVLTMGIAGKPYYAVIGVLVHFGMREATRHNPHWFALHRAWFQTKARSLTTHRWGGSRLQPSPAFVRRAQDVRSCL